MGPLETTAVDAATEPACCCEVVRFERRNAIATFLDVERLYTTIAERVYVATESRKDTVVARVVKDR